MNKNPNPYRDCKYYDYGRTCPTVYGAFCELNKCVIDNVSCELCSENKKDTSVEFTGRNLVIKCQKCGNVMFTSCNKINDDKTYIGNGIYLGFNGDVESVITFDAKLVCNKCGYEHCLN